MTKRVSRTPLLEWVVGGLGALLFAGILGAVLWHGLTDRGAPPAIVVEVTGIEPVTGGHVVRFEARNTGDITAAQVRIAAVLSNGQSEPEEHEATIDFLPPQSVRRGGFFFEQDPRNGALNIRADGYNDP